VGIKQKSVTRPDHALLSRAARQLSRDPNAESPRDGGRARDGGGSQTVERSSWRHY